jgi:predicted nucleic acid-binding protein
LRSFFDTNVVVYLFDGDAPEKQVRARELLAREVGKGQAVLSTQVLQEFYVTVTRKLTVPLSPDEALRALQDLAELPLVQVDADLITGAARRCARDQVSFWDGLILQAALRAGATVLYSEDLQDGRTIEGLRIRNPFA